MRDVRWICYNYLETTNHVIRGTWHGVIWRVSAGRRIPCRDVSCRRNVGCHLLAWATRKLENILSMRMWVAWMWVAGMLVDWDHCKVHEGFPFIHMNLTYAQCGLRVVGIFNKASAPASAWLCVISSCKGNSCFTWENGSTVIWNVLGVTKRDIMPAMFKKVERGGQAT